MYGMSRPNPPTSPNHKLLTKLFWPDYGGEVPKTSSMGFLVGWNIRSFNGSIAHLETSVGLQQLEAALDVIAKDPRLAPLHEYCCGSPVVLGEWRMGYKTRRDSDQKSVLEKRQSATIWLNVEADSISGTQLPIFKEIYCCGYRYLTNCQIVSYVPPKKVHNFMQFPMQLDTSSAAASAAQTKVELSDMEVALRQMNSAREIQIVLQHCIHVITGAGAIPQRAWVKPRRDSDNVEEFLGETPSTIYDPTPRVDDTPRIDEPQTPHSEDATTPKSPSSEDGAYGEYQEFLQAVLSSPRYRPAPADHRFLKFAARVFLQPYIWLYAGWHLLAGALLKLLNVKHPWGALLKDWSAFGQQFDTRIREVSAWPASARKVDQDRAVDLHSRAFQMGFYSSFCCILVDVILGMLLSVFLYSNPEFGPHVYQQFDTADMIKSWIVWFMGLPAGFKLNSNLDMCLGISVLAGTDLWVRFLHFFEPFWVYIYKAVALSGILGASFTLSLIGDLLSLLTLHMFGFYSFFAKVYQLQLVGLSAAWKLFRGKKKNPLRQRIDSYQYDMDQLMLGTILFTLLFFLFPTVAIYYFFFVLTRLSILGLQMIVALSVAALNHFPLFTIIVYVFDRKKLPAGISFTILEGPTSAKKPLASPEGRGIIPMKRQSSLTAPKTSATYLKLNGGTLGFGSLFFQYGKIVSQLVKHCFSPIVGCLMGGKFLPLVPHLTYPIEKRSFPVMSEFWVQLQAWRDIVLDHSMSPMSS